MIAELSVTPHKMFLKQRGSLQQISDIYSHKVLLNDLMEKQAQRNTVENKVSWGGGGGVED